MVGEDVQTSTVSCKEAAGSRLRLSEETGVTGETDERQKAIIKITVTAILQVLNRVFFRIDNGILSKEFFIHILLNSWNPFGY